MVRHPGHHRGRHLRGLDLVLTHPALRGLVTQERFRLPEILSNRFGRYYSQGDTKDVSGRRVVTGKAGRQRQIRREGRAMNTAEIAELLYRLDLAPFNSGAWSGSHGWAEEPNVRA